MLLTMFALAMAAPQCTKQVDLPQGLSGWSRSGAGLDTRHATTLAAKGGQIETRVTIRKAGVFGVAIDRDGWIDVSPAKGKALRFVSQNRGPRCSGIQKIVRYQLQPGEYRVTVGKLKGDKAKLMLVRGQRS